MVFRLSEKETAILLGAALMHWGVPFYFTKRREPTQFEQDSLDDISHRLRKSRNNMHFDDEKCQLEFKVSNDELRLLTEVLVACQNECGDDKVDRWLHLRAKSKTEVDDLIQRLRTVCK